jgi:hypothetical protein
MKIAEFSNEVDVELDKTMYLFLLDDINVKFNG